MAKRESFGNIRKLPSGNYQARYTGPDGNVHRADKPFLRKGLAQTWLEEEHALIRFGDWTPPAERRAAKKRKAEAEKYTVEKACAEWLKVKKRTLKKSTYAKYEQQVKLRIENQKIWNMPVGEVTRDVVIEWWDAITDEYPTQASNSRAYVILKSVFDRLVKSEKITVNPVLIDVSEREVKPTHTQDDALTMEELAAIYHAIEQPYKVVCALTMFHGLRIGEALAIRRKNVTVEKGRITVKVEDNLQRIKDPKTGKMKMTSMESTKNGKTRDVEIAPPFHADFIAALNLADDFITTNPDSNDPLADNNYNYRLKKAAKEAGITRRVHAHAGRYALTTSLLEENFDPKTVASVIGDTDIHMVMSVYARVSEERQRSAQATHNATIQL